VVSTFKRKPTPIIDPPKSKKGADYQEYKKTGFEEIQADWYVLFEFTTRVAFVIDDCFLNRPRSRAQEEFNANR